MAKKKTKTTWRRWRGKVLQNCCQTQGRIHQAIEQGTSGHIVHVKGDVFAARPRKNVPERSKRPQENSFPPAHEPHLVAPDECRSHGVAGESDHRPLVVLDGDQILGLETSKGLREVRPRKSGGRADIPSHDLQALDLGQLEGDREHHEPLAIGKRYPLTIVFQH